ncbi:hypothetical protein BFV94_2172 [Alteromonas macleodii]|nr:hypothetical protein BFV94_2172 [Alteromonas macleodii]OES32315.1 hypothetical protein BFV93_2166 [Alteromonas macleodii]
MKMKNDLSWFDFSNYAAMESLDREQLNYELIMRRLLIEEIEAEAELDKLYPKLRNHKREIPSKLKSIIQGAPSFSKSTSFLPQIALENVSDLKDNEHMNLLSDYQYTKHFSPMRDRSAVRLRTTREAVEDYRRLRDFQGDLLFEYGFSKENGDRIDFFLEYSNLSELPARDRNNKLPAGDDIALSLNIKDFTNEELIQSFKALLNEARAFYKCPPPKRDQVHRKDDMKKLFAYRVFALIDAEIWRSLVNPSMTKSQVINHVLSGTEKGYGYANYEKTIKAFISKVLSPNYSLPQK